MARQLPNLGLTAFFNRGEDGWNDEMDQNLLKVSALTQGVVKSKLAAEPGAPVEGDVHLLDENHATHANEIIIYDAGDWVYITPAEGWLVFNQADNYYEKFDGSAWAELATGSSGGGGTTVLPEFRGALLSITAAKTALNLVTATTLSWDQADYDTSLFWSASNPTRLTIPAILEGMKVRVYGYAHLDNITNSEHSRIVITKNGADAVISPLATQSAEVGTSTLRTQLESPIVEVTEGDYFELSIDLAADSSVDLAVGSYFGIEVITSDGSTIEVGNSRLALTEVNTTTTGAGSSSEYNTKGNCYLVTKDGKILGTKISFGDTGQTYKVMVAEIDNATGLITSILHSGTSRPYSVLKEHLVIFDSVVDVTAGQYIAIMLVRTDGTSTSPANPPFPGSTTDDLLTGFEHQFAVREDIANPSVGNTIRGYIDTGGNATAKIVLTLIHTVEEFDNLLGQSLPAEITSLNKTETAYTIHAENRHKYLRFTATTAKTVTVALQDNQAYSTNFEVSLRNVGAENLTLAGEVGVTINVPYGGTLVVPTGGTVTLKRVGTNEFDLIGQTVAA